MANKFRDAGRLQNASRAHSSRREPAPSRQTLRRLLLWAWLVAVTTSLAGCGSDETPKRRSLPYSAVGVADPNDTAPAPPPPQNSQPAENPPEETTEPDTGNEPEEAAEPDTGNEPEEATEPDGDGASDEQDTDSPGTPDQPGTEPDEQAAPAEDGQRPENFADWKKEDYFAARAENDPRLLEAVAYLGNQFVGSPNVAQGLAALLAPPEAPAASPDQPQQPTSSTPAQDPKLLIEAIVAALGVNGSDAAREILELLLAGTLRSEDDQTAVDAVLQTLAANASEKNEDLLFRVLTEAEKLRPEPAGEAETDGQTPSNARLKAEDLRSKAFEVIAPVAGNRLRTRLAGHLVQPDIPDELRKLLSDFLGKDDPYNLGAQLFLYNNDATPPEFRAKLEGYFAPAGSRTIGQILGVSAQGYGGGSSSGGARGTQPDDPDLPYRVAGALWTAPWADLVEEHLAELDSLQQQEKLFALATTLPLDSTRCFLLKTLKSHWEEGPKALEAAGVAGTLIGDPGMVQLVKTTAREKMPSRTIGRTAIEKFQTTKKEWEKFSETLIRAWCDRLHAANKARTGATSWGTPQPDQGDQPIDLPIDLHKEANVTAQYRVSWPSDFGGKLAGTAVGPLEVRYVRIEDKLDPETMLGHYKRQVGELNPRRTENTAWTESLRLDPQTNRRRSIDVIIEGSNKNAAKAGQKPPKEQDLVIQILSIEINDPATE